MIPITEDDFRFLRTNTITETELLALYERWQDARAEYRNHPITPDDAPITIRFQADLVEREMRKRIAVLGNEYEAAFSKFAAQKRSVAL